MSQITMLINDTMGIQLKLNQFYTLIFNLKQKIIYLTELIVFPYSTLQKVNIEWTLEVIVASPCSKLDLTWTQGHSDEQQGQRQQQTEQHHVSANATCTEVLLVRGRSIVQFKNKNQGKQVLPPQLKKPQPRDKS